MATTIQYHGSELELFADATNWKRYWSSRIAPYLAGDVLDVGAGSGNNAFLVNLQRHSHWTCLEPDAALLDEARHKLSSACEYILGTCRDLPDHQLYDSILYIDVLEHIEHDRSELACAAAHLRPNGHLMVLAPAHPGLFSNFDQAIGHHRRYTKQSLAALEPPQVSLVRHEYLDSCGLALSAANRLVLRQDLPTSRQIRFWDRCVIPVSRVVDKLTRYSMGKSVLAVWKKPPA